MRELAGHQRVALDSSALLYFLYNDEQRAPMVRDLLDASAREQIQIVMSVLSVAEIRVRPLRAQSTDAVGRIDALIDGPFRLRVVGVDRSTAEDGARVRAEHGLGLVDAIVVATALRSDCTALVGNDADFRRARGQISYVHLDDEVAR